MIVLSIHVDLVEMNKNNQFIIFSNIWIKYTINQIVKVEKIRKTVDLTLSSESESYRDLGDF